MLFRSVRAAIGQLLTYRYFLYEPENAPHLLACFSESVGEAFVRLLEELGIASVWPDGPKWVGSRLAQDLGLV